MVAVLCSLTVLDCFSLRAQEKCADTREFCVYFPQGDSSIRPSYMSNTATLDSLKSVISRFSENLEGRVNIVAAASPEGDRKYNFWLAGRRAEKMETYLVNLCPQLAGRISSETIIAPWPKDEHDLVNLRYAKFVLVYNLPVATEEPEAPKAPELEIPEIAADGEIVIENAPATDNDEIRIADIPEYAAPVEPAVPAEPSRNMLFAAKTNLLFDAITALNVEFEVPIGRRFSVMVEDVFPWWEIGNKYCLQHWEMGVEARFWFTPWETRSEEKLRGFFAGIYGMSALFDLQWDTLLNFQGEYWSTGFTGGWCTPIGRKKRMNLELSLGLGYAHVPYQHYLPTDSYDKLIRDKSRAGNLEYIFGPTKAKVSLVIPICSKKKEVRHE